MWNILEHPWTLLVTAVVLLLVVAIIQTFKSNRLFFLIPLTVALLAPALDFAVRTDREKIKTVIDTVVTAVENEDTGTIAQLLAQDYKDSAHRSKDAMVRKFRALLHPPLVEDIYDSILEMQISGDTATVTLLNRLFIDPRSNYAEFAKIVLVKMEIDLKKTLDGQWLITRTEILAINNQPTKWSNVGYIDW